MSTLGRLAGKAPAVSKSKLGKPEFHDPTLDPVITTIIEQKQAKETAETLLAQAEDQFGATVGPKRLLLCRQMGRVEASVRVNGRITYTQQCRYSTVPQEQRELIEAAFGEQFKVFFSDTFKVAMTTEAAADEAFVNRLIELIGEEEFIRRFTVRRDLDVTPAFHSAFTLDKTVEEKARPLIDAGVVRPFKASNRQ